MALRWYVVRVQVGREDKIAENLQKRIQTRDLGEVVPEILVPSEKVTEIRSGKKTVRDRKIFPGYIMVHMDLTEEGWMVVRETPGVGDFLGSGKPTPMEPREVDRLLRTSPGAEDKPMLKITFGKGDSVRIKQGPFENFDAVVEEVNAQRGTVRLTVTIFGRATPVEMEYWQVEPV